MTHFTPTLNPMEFPTVFAKNFNTGDIDTVLAGYSDDAVLSLGSGKVFRGHVEIRQALETLLAPALPIVVQPRSCSMTDDVAIVLFNWSIEGKAPDGGDFSLRGAAVDVLKLSSDGCWKQVLDHPFGSATEPDVL